jgi:hypothetical protein
VRYLTFHGFARALVGSEGSLEAAEHALIEYLTDSGPLPYEHLIVDEGHDFKRIGLSSYNTAFEMVRLTSFTIAIKPFKERRIPADSTKFLAGLY